MMIVCYRPQMADRTASLDTVQEKQDFKIKACSHRYRIQIQFNHHHQCPIILIAIILVKAILSFIHPSYLIFVIK